MSESHPDVQAVLFDAGGTLVLPDAHELADALAEVGITVDPDGIQLAMARAAHGLDPALPGHTDAEFQENFFPTVFELLDVPCTDIDAAMDVYRHLHFRPEGIWKAPAAGGREVVVEVRRRGLRTAVVSNSDGRVARHLVDGGYEPDLFEFVVDSFLVGVAKPEPEIFLEAARRLDLPPETCLYVGDIVGIDVAGATAAGMHAVHIDAAGLYGKPDGHYRIRDIGELLTLPPVMPGSRGRPVAT